MSNKKSILFVWIMWLVVAFFYAYRYLLEVAPSVMVPDLMQNFAHDATLLGHLTAFYLYAYTLMQIPVGLLLDRFQARRVLTMAVFVAALGCLIFASSQVFWLAALGRFFSGFGAAFAAVGCMYVAANWLPKKRFALATGLVLTIGMFGAISGEAPLAWCVAMLGWRKTLMALSILGGALTFLIWSVVRDTVVEEKVEEGNNISSLWRGLLHLLLDKRSWCVAGFAGLMFMSISIFGSLWGVPFLMAKYQISNRVAATLMIFMFLGLASGAPFWGWWSNYINKRKIVLIIVSLGSLLSMTALLYGLRFPDFIAAVLLYVFGFFTGGCLIAFALMLEINAGKHVGSVLGFTNVLNMIGGALGQPLAGWLLDIHWHAGAVLTNVRVYSLSDYQWALTILPITLSIALLLSFFVPETNCRNLPIKD
jgi:predicted MFS family arabinose efflux permease